MFKETHARAEVFKVQYRRTKYHHLTISKPVLSSYLKIVFIITCHLAHFFWISLPLRIFRPECLVPFMLVYVVELIGAYVLCSSSGSWTWPDEIKVNLIGFERFLTYIMQTYKGESGHCFRHSEIEMGGRSVVNPVVSVQRSMEYTTVEGGNHVLRWLVSEWLSSYDWFIWVSDKSSLKNLAD
jgi:hypothetical protein